MNELALFAGAGGGILGGHLLGWRTICAVEWDAYARDVLVARQNDGCLEAFPVWDDVQTFDGRPWRGRVDVVSGGFPCQDISCAGKGAGIEGERSSMWKHMARIIGEVRPRFVFVENSPMLVGRGLAVVIADLAKMGYDAKWGIVGAHHAGAPHKRDRIWIKAELCHSDSHSKPVVPVHDEASELQRNVEPRGTSWGSGICHDVADSMRSRPQGAIGSSLSRQSTGHALQCCGGADVADANGTGCKEQRRSISDGQEHETAECGGWWATEPDVGRVAYELAARVDRLRCIGNGQVPAVAKLAWETLTN
jgi:DNA (cytosine-5)-methyltransferase 1